MCTCMYTTFQPVSLLQCDCMCLAVCQYGSMCVWYVFRMAVCVYGVCQYGSMCVWYVCQYGSMCLAVWQYVCMVFVSMAICVWQYGMMFVSMAVRVWQYGSMCVWYVCQYGSMCVWYVCQYGSMCVWHVCQYGSMCVWPHRERREERERLREERSAMRTAHELMLRGALPLSAPFTGCGATPTN